MSMCHQFKNLLDYIFKKKKNSWIIICIHFDIPCSQFRPRFENFISQLFLLSNLFNVFEENYRPAICSICARRSLYKNLRFIQTCKKNCNVATTIPNPGQYVENLKLPKNDKLGKSIIQSIILLLECLNILLSRYIAENNTPKALQQLDYKQKHVIIYISTRQGCNCSREITSQHTGRMVGRLGLKRNLLCSKDCPYCPKGVGSMQHYCDYCYVSPASLSTIKLPKMVCLQILSSPGPT